MQVRLLVTEFILFYFGKRTSCRDRSRIAEQLKGQSRNLYRSMLARNIMVTSLIQLVVARNPMATSQIKFMLLNLTKNPMTAL